MTTHTVDTFTGTSGTGLESHTPDSGASAWTNIDGSANRLQLDGSGNLNIVSSATADAAYSVPVGSVDMYVQGTLGTNFPGSNGMYLVVRLTDKNNFYGLSRGSSTVWNIYKRVGGSFTSLKGITGITTVSGDVFRLEVSGTSPPTLTAYQNGVQIGTITDAAASFTTQTLAGLLAHGGGAVSNVLRDYESDALGGGSTTVTLAQASWSWTGNAANVNAKSMLALAQAAWAWTGNAAGIDARSDLTLAQALWPWTGFPANVAGNAAVTLAQAAWDWIGIAAAVNAKAAVTLAQAAWDWIGNAPAIATVVTLRKATWQWVGRPLATGQIILGRLMALLGVGQ